MSLFNKLQNLLGGIKNKQASAKENFVAMMSPNSFTVTAPEETPTPTPTAQPKGYDIKPDQKYKVLATILAEAQSEGRSGMHAVVNAMNNRVGTPNLTGGTRNNIFDVVSEPAQFSAFQTGNSIYKKYRDYLRGEKVKLTTEEKQKLNDATDLLDKASTGQLEDITGGANQYYNPKKASPTWAKQMKNPIQIGEHLFGIL